MLRIRGTKDAVLRRMSGDKASAEGGTARAGSSASYWAKTRWQVRVTVDVRGTAAP